MSYLGERDNIRVEELCDAINEAFYEAERVEVTFEGAEHPHLPRYIWEEVAERARRAGHDATFDGYTLTVRRKREP